MLSISILIPIINDINAAPSKATTPFPSKEKLSMHRNPRNIKLDNFDPISSRREEKIRLKFPEIFLPFLLLHGGNFSKFQGEEKCKCENFQFGMEARDVCGHLRRNCLRLAFLDIPRGQLNRADTFYITVLKSSFIEREIKWFGRVESINPRRQRFLLFRRKESYVATVCMLIERGPIWNGPSRRASTWLPCRVEFLHERQCENSFNVPSFHFSRSQREVSRVFSKINLKMDPFPSMDGQIKSLDLRAKYLLNSDVW